MSDVAYKYVGPGHLLGVPAHDLTADEVANLEAGPLADLQASAIYESLEPPSPPEVVEENVAPSSGSGNQRLRRNKVEEVNNDG